MVSLWDICNSSWCQRFSFLLSFFHFVKTYQNCQVQVLMLMIFFFGFHILPYHYFLTNLFLTDVTISSKKWCHLYNLWHYFEIYVLVVDAILRWYNIHSFFHFCYYIGLFQLLDSCQQYGHSPGHCHVCTHIASNVGWWWLLHHCWLL